MLAHYINNPKALEVKRLTRIIKAIKWVGLLSENEATHCLEMYRQGFTLSGSEAVCHYGGNKKVISDAVRLRHLV